MVNENSCPRQIFFPACNDYKDDDEKYYCQKTECCIHIQRIRIFMQICQAGFSMDNRFGKQEVHSRRGSG